MAKASTGYIDLADGKLYYEMAGDGETLVLGHADAIKGAKNHIFSQSAHVPNMEEPEAFTQVVLSFLDEAPQSSIAW